LFRISGGCSSHAKLTQGFEGKDEKEHVDLHCKQMNNRYFSSQFFLKKMKHPTCLTAKMLTFFEHNFFLLATCYRIPHISENGVKFYVEYDRIKKYGTQEQNLS
jgi:hypothetical protein